ncbi:Hypothetical protein R9X50_00329300 [Acrodontium crateriforme]|uniref:Uncharacterized protein n=1 Tax=Acrodontium crateriforme TaxID=150365 RepID=A0AAQ3R7B1_9PEZI|nr:Hypothetical protein R9X50_00329300 [Acrodontium crateriforme]
MSTTDTVLIPISTLTIPTVSLETVFWTVTVHAPTAAVTNGIRSSSSKSDSIASTTVTVSSFVTLPPVVIPNASGDSSSCSHAPSVTSSATLSASPSTTNTPTGAAATSYHKHAIIGGLSGAIGGLLLIGVILGLFLRRKRRRYECELEDEKRSLGEIANRRWNDGTGSAGSLGSTPQIARIGSPMAVDEDDHIIRMSFSHWVRPFAHGKGEGWRDSTIQGQLRVTNPDLSRPVTPKPTPDEGSPSFLKHPRSALAAVLGGHNRSRTNSRSDLRPTPPIPERIVPHAPSQELLIPKSNPSCRSYPSAPSLAVVRQRPPEDPFASSDDQRICSKTRQRLSNASATSLQGAASRTASHLGDFLNSMKQRPQNSAESKLAIHTIRQVSPGPASSICTGGSGPHTGRSDPFDLSISENEGNGERRNTWRKSSTWNNKRPSFMMNYSPYEGT